ncbi:serine acetyltransferase [Paenibacillus sp. ATY16]|uniref:serine O-acetyltransferase n=1 Tax=Paenibacillus sp. ATY16 TaxID=1759312 RepID=UPI0020104FBB|nr:serine acetyltransferase [Paenibacillus sp. ATY16]MCK9861964.1 serine acetyltransferase [Paenibacillus sp. ATY16]
MKQITFLRSFNMDLNRYVEQMNIKGKYSIYKVLIFSILGIGPIQSVMFYRIASWFALKKVPFVHYIFVKLNMILHGAEISAYASIGPGLFIAHPQGIVIGRNAVVGNNLMIFQNVTIGAKNPFDGLELMPSLGDNVTLYAGCKVLGPIVVGSNSKIGANVVLGKDLSENSVVVIDSSVYKTI